MSQTTPEADEGFLAARKATIAYDDRVICDEISVGIPEHSFTVILGPNACGKSTLLRSFARVLSPQSGSIVLDSKDLREYRSKDLARRIGLLPQSALTPDGIRVGDLVSRGRHPHRALMRQWTATDDEAVNAAMTATKIDELSDRYVDELSGGQRQRVWISMLLAQQTPTLLLDEPTTFLDIAHQYDLLELLRGLHEGGKTIVAVLHDLNQAARYADHLIVMKAGSVVATGAPADVLTSELIQHVFDLPSLVIPDPVTGTPSVVPLDPRAR